MPITKSAKKAQRQSVRKAAINKPVKSTARTSVKTVRQTPNTDNLTKAFSSLDKAAKKNLFHKNKVNRLKSRLSKLVARSAK